MKTRGALEQGNQTEVDTVKQMLICLGKRAYAPRSD